MRFCSLASHTVQDAIIGNLCSSKYTMRFKNLQPDVIVERYLDAKYYQHSPEAIHDMSDYNSNAKYLADSDQIITLNAMETDDLSICASLRDNMQELAHSIPECPVSPYPLN